MSKITVMPKRAASDRRLTLADFRVLMALCELEPASGWLREGHESMAKRLGLHSRTIKKAIGALVESGYVIREPQYHADGAQGCNAYKIIYEPEAGEFHE